MFKKGMFFTILLAFCINSMGPIPGLAESAFSEVGGLRLPAPGVMVHLSPEFHPPTLKGIRVHPDNPFRFDFILDHGDAAGVSASSAATRLVKYFLASLTTPEKDLWVNLSPYEKDRIIPQSFGLTEMGRDLLAEDYMLKQITASLAYPEDKIGKEFWKRIYEEAAKRFGTTDIPVNTFNKVWIVPEKAVVYENAKAGTAYIIESRLKVMLEQDYLSLKKHLSERSEMASVGANIVREIIIPELTREVNEGKNFAQLRQVYNSLILANWYKKKIKDSILEKVYADKNKTAGVEYTASVISPKSTMKFRNDVEGLYQEYLKAFKKGVYNYIKEVPDPVTQTVVPRKYFSGGIQIDPNIISSQKMDAAMLSSDEDSILDVEIIPEAGPSWDEIREHFDEVLLKDKEAEANASSPLAHVIKALLSKGQNRRNEEDRFFPYALPENDASWQEIAKMIAMDTDGQSSAFRDEMTKAIVDVLSDVDANTLKNAHQRILMGFIAPARMKAAYRLWQDEDILDEKDVLEALINIEARINANQGFYSNVITTLDHTRRETAVLHNLVNERLLNFNDEEYSSEDLIPGSAKVYTQRVTTKGYIIFLWHAPQELAPDIFNALGILWKEIFEAKNLQDRYEALARYEWWFYQGNLLGRAGASMGDAMSVIAQKELGIKLRDTFVHQDYQALSLPLEKYVEQRVKEFDQDSAQLARYRAKTVDELFRKDFDREYNVKSKKFNVPEGREGEFTREALWLKSQGVKNEHPFWSTEDVLAEAFKEWKSLQVSKKVDTLDFARNAAREICESGSFYYLGKLSVAAKRAKTKEIINSRWLDLGTSSRMHTSVGLVSKFIEQTEWREVGSFEYELKFKDDGVSSGDQAMNARNGGIDLSSDNILSVQNNGQGIKFRMDPAQLATLHNLSGFVPVIRSVHPITNLRRFLTQEDFI